MTRWRQAFLDSPSLITLNYVVVALLAATVVGGPNGLPLRRWIASEAPDAWTAPPTERDGYFYEVWLGPRSNPYVVARAIMAMEGETLGKPWNWGRTPSTPHRRAQPARTGREPRQRFGLGDR